MRIRKSSRELCYTAAEFKQLSLPAICRRYGLGSDWVDQERDQAAEASAPNV